MILRRKNPHFVKSGLRSRYPYSKSEMMSKIPKRILKDILEVKTEAYEAQGIYYWSDPTTVFKGQALIRGNEKTPYEFGYGLFDITFPQDYPFQPPIVLWKTGDGSTRFHPQLYREGKVCLSILGTWNGPGWASCMNLSSILQILQSLFVENPLACEPGYENGTLQDVNYKGYSDLVEFQWCSLMGLTLKQLKQTNHSVWENFQEPMDEQYESMKQKLLQKVKEKSGFSDIEYSNIPFCHRTFRTQWKHLLPKLESLP